MKPTNATKSIVAIAVDAVHIPTKRREKIAEFRQAMRDLEYVNDDATFMQLIELLATNASVGADDWWQP